ncbi:hypothetical protein [Streptomyces thioluteus]
MGLLVLLHAVLTMGWSRRLCVRRLAARSVFERPRVRRALTG